jgi:hypothetical protein
MSEVSDFRPICSTLRFNAVEHIGFRSETENIGFVWAWGRLGRSGIIQNQIPSSRLKTSGLEDLKDQGYFENLRHWKTRISEVLNNKTQTRIDVGSL